MTKQGATGWFAKGPHPCHQHAEPIAIVGTGTEPLSLAALTSK